MREFATFVHSLYLDSELSFQISVSAREACTLALTTAMLLVIAFDGFDTSLIRLSVTLILLIPGAHWKII